MFDRECGEMSIGCEIAGSTGLQKQIAKDAPVTVAGFERRNRRLSKPRLDRMQGIVNRQRMLEDPGAGCQSNESEQDGPCERDTLFA